MAKSMSAAELVCISIIFMNFFEWWLFWSSRFQKPLPTPSSTSLVVIPLEVQSITRNFCRARGSRLQTVLFLCLCLFLLCCHCREMIDRSGKPPAEGVIGVCFLVSGCRRGLHCEWKCCVRTERKGFICVKVRICVFVGKSHSFSLLKSN